MIDLQEAQQRVLEQTRILPKKRLPLAEALGQVLAEEVRTYEDIPGFDSSAMDGFAVHPSDTEGATPENPVVLKVAGEIRAGCAELHPLSRKNAIRIFTGAPVPPGAGAILIKEHAEDQEERVLVFQAPAPGAHIRKKGAEFARGNRIFPQGFKVTPSVVGMLASLGLTEVEVFDRPRTALIVTGDELKPIDASLEPGQIRDANSHSLAAALRSMGLQAPLCLHARDDLESVKAAFTQALSEADLVISVGGVSVGKYDYVKEALHQLKVRPVFWRVAMKPGKPNYFARQGDKLVFGLPGNPVSAMVSLFVLVRPALWKMQGRGGQEGFRLKALLGSDLRKKDPRLELVRGNLTREASGGFRVTPVTGRDSHMLGNLALADSLIYFPREKDFLAAGEEVEVEPLNWSEL